MRRFEVAKIVFRGRRQINVKRVVMRVTDNLDGSIYRLRVTDVALRD